MRVRVFQRIRLFSLFAVLLIAFPALADERILSFESFIEVQKNADLVVTETIRVKTDDVITDGSNIRHGIYRDFPTDYKDPDGHHYVVDMDVQYVMRDGEREDYHIARRSNGKRIYMGSKNYYVSPGEHTYRLTYRVNRELGFFKDHDELFWNVNGLGWIFPIDSVSAIVKLPPGASEKLALQKAYTGANGDYGTDYKTEKTPDGLILFQSTRHFEPYEGMSIVVGWPKGFVDPPGNLQQMFWLFRDNLHLFIGLFGLTLLLTYYLVIWYQVGRDPKPGTIIPLFEPPDNLSPAAMRYILNMGPDNKGFTAAVLNLAVKGVIKIQEIPSFMFSKIYQLQRISENPAALSKDERAILDQLLPTNNFSLELRNTNALQIQSAISSFNYALQKQIEHKFYVTNMGWFLTGILIALATAVPMFMIGDIQDPEGISLAPFGISVAMLIIIIGFKSLLKAPTLAGRKVMDRIDGFQRFLSVTEKDRLNFATPVNITPELFEKYLPYALALDVENQWAKKFEATMAAAGQAIHDSYHPSWYMGDHDFSPSSFSSSMGSSFSDAISSSSVSPGSSSGGGGSCSSCGSGGGGGGGGGGGW